MTGPSRIPTRLDEERFRRAPWRGPWLVRCPRCDGCAHAEPEQARLVCPACSLVRAGRIELTDDGHVCQTSRADARFTRDRPAPAGRTAPATPSRTIRHELWLREPCCDGQTLWAVNASHFASLERYVSGVLRGGTPPPPVWRPQQHLPAWLSRREHRIEVLGSIARLRGRLAAARQS